MSANQSTLLGAGGLKRKFQYFSASGTFTPTQAMLDAGGVLELDIRGGGGGGGYDGLTNYAGQCGGSSRHVDRYQLISLTPITVTVGTGGAGNSNGTGTQGGTSSFGSVSVPGGFGGAIYGDGVGPGKGTGNMGTSAKITIFGLNDAYTGKVKPTAVPDTGWAGSGCGGAPGGNGCSGSILVEWWEKA